MCGRFTLYADDQELVRLFDIDVVEGEHGESFNEAPSQLIRSVRTKSDEQRELDLMKWGLVPFWAKDSFKPLINARAETVTEKSAFKTATSRRRCLIPTNGYYEWKVEADGKKQPYFLSLATDDGTSAAPGAEPIVAMAGIFDWPTREEREKEPEWEQGELGVEKRLRSIPAPTSAVITRAATDTLGHIHDRMPLFIPTSAWSDWLNPELTDLGDIRALIDQIGTPPIVTRRVGKAVGNVRNNRPDLILPAVDPE
ncbi:SOS response-associated peptidase [Actinomycetaceae bacterium MB13-C1-2]|nr:SOS response-associated peptidase [Actinomycetaceae bacterium MB13-C1-2]